MVTLSSSLGSLASIRNQGIDGTGSTADRDKALSTMLGTAYARSSSKRWILGSSCCDTLDGFVLIVVLQLFWFDNGVLLDGIVLIVALQLFWFKNGVFIVYLYS